MAQNYVLLERIELNASAASVTFSNIPQSGYTDLKVVCSTRTATAAVGDAVYLALGGTLTAKRLQGNGASATSDTDYYGAWNTGANATASTFGNTEFYIPNYTSSNAKSFTSDSVSENNATTAYSSMIAYLSSSTSAISTITLGTESGASFVQYSTFSLYALAAVGTTPAIAPKASGGNITTDGTYWIHTFLATDTFTPFTALSCDYLVVAGGGAGNGNYGGGGGGCGGITYVTSGALTVSTNYVVTVGAGGAGNPTPATNGSNSVFSSTTSNGGYGGGGTQGGINGGPGGNAGSPLTTTGGTGVISSYSERGGGGAGAGANGGNYQSTAGGDGGNGSANSITGTSVTRGGGGGGGGARDTNGGLGGTGGGGNGGQSSGAVGIAGTANTGGGGGGGRETYGGNGGSGIVIIRYTIA